jgi:predicted esterase
VGRLTVSPNPHLGVEPLVSGVAPAEARAAAVLVHGRGQGPETMLELARVLALDDVHYVLPAAAGGSWYPQRFNAPVEANEPWLSFALEAYDAVVARLGGAGWPPERLALVGFSQGACLTLEYVARNPGRYGGVAALTGGLIGTDGSLTQPIARVEAPILITSKERDVWVPAERTRASAAILEAAGAEVDLRIFPGAEHSVTGEEVDAVRRLIRTAPG